MVLETLVGLAVIVGGIATWVGLCILWTRFFNRVTRNSQKFGQAEVGNTMLGSICLFVCGWVLLAGARELGNVLVR